MDVTDEDWALAMEGLIDALLKSAQQRTLTRVTMHLTTTLDTIDTKHIWPDSLRVFEEALKSSGMMNYVLTGMDRDVNYTWEEIFNDANAFLHSDLMMAYDEGTFWKDVYYLLLFLDEALE